MQKIDFAATVDLIITEDPRFDRDAYFFIKDALEFTVEQTKKTRERGTNHVSGRQLLEGIRDYALKYFGPMVPTVFEAWGITACEQFGEMVYLLIQKGILESPSRIHSVTLKGSTPSTTRLSPPSSPRGCRSRPLSPGAVAPVAARSRRPEWRTRLRVHRLSIAFPSPFLSDS